MSKNISERVRKIHIFSRDAGGGGSAQFQANNRGISSAQINNQKKEVEIDLRRFWQVKWFEMTKSILDPLSNNTNSISLNNLYLKCA